jgi:tyrosyl-tRNA synthetase
MTETQSKDASFLLRNVVEALPEGGLERKLAEGRPLRVKLGIDPTAADIHLGHTVVLRKLREFQDAGHTIVLIIGDYTARVGDPSGRSSERPVLSPADIDANAETYQRQAFKVLDPERVEVRHNGEWLDMPMEDLFRLARVSTVAQLLERDDFAKRYREGVPISVLELLYPLMQGYDSVAVRADVELGGTDQKFNLLLGRDIQGAYEVPPQVAVTMPILPGIDGVKRMSKSGGNYVGVTEPPAEQFGKLMRVPDEAMPVYYELLLDTPFDPSRPAVERSWRATTTRTRRARRRRPSTGCMWRRPSRTASRRRFCRPATWSTSPRSCASISVSPPPRRAGCSGRAACGSTASSSGRATSTCRRRGSTGRCCRWGSGGTCASGPHRKRARVPDAAACERRRSTRRPPPATHRFPAVATPKIRVVVDPPRRYTHGSP